MDSCDSIGEVPEPVMTTAVCNSMSWNSLSLLF